MNRWYQLLTMYQLIRKSPRIRHHKLDAFTRPSQKLNSKNKTFHNKCISRIIRLIHIHIHIHIHTTRMKNKYQTIHPTQYIRMIN